MTTTSTITSKRQLTIPSSFFSALGWEEGQKVVVTMKDNNSLVISPATKLVDQLAGSVKMPKRFEGLKPDDIIKKAKKEYFQGK